MKNVKLETYQKSLEEKELAKGTISLYICQAKQLHKYAGERRFTKKIILEYKKELEGRKLAASTFNLYLVAINSYLKFLGLEMYRLKLLKVQKKRSLPEILQEKEYREMLAYAKESGREKYYYIMKTLALTGIRISELCYFTVEALDEKVIMVSNKGKYREIYISDNLLTELRKFCKESNITGGVIFKGNKNQPISRSAVYKMLVHMADMLGIRKEVVNPHSFRHLFAVTYMEKHSNLFELADILGHSSVETTRVYTATTIEMKRIKIDNLGL